MNTGLKQHKVPLTLITAMLVLVIAVLAGSSLLILRSMQQKYAQVSAALSVVDLGRVMAAHFGNQPIVTSSEPTDDAWSRLSSQVRTLCAMEEGLQYVSVIRDGVTLFHEQRGSFENGGESVEESLSNNAASVTYGRRLLDIGGETVPVVIFANEITGKGGVSTIVEVAIRRDTVEREGLASEYAIAGMFKVALVTVIISFAVCILLVVWMMRREVQREARRRDEEHLAFAGVMANGIVHDFRNPMSSLKLDVQMIAKELEKESGIDMQKIRNIADRSRKTIDRMDKVFEEFLYVSKPPSDQRESVDLNLCINECLTIMEPRIKKASIKLNVTLPDEPVKVLVYRASFHRALMNVMLNAEQFATQKDGEVSVNVSQKAGFAVIDIMDNGPGVSKSDRHKIFEIFESSRPGGTGLGLFFARTAIESSGGKISEENRREGGACFTIEVPLADEET